jgi:hypothetical protein
MVTTELLTSLHQVSKYSLVCQGVLQGGILSPTLFLVFINDLVADLPSGITVEMYPDDLIMWCKDEYASKMLQRAIDA